MPEKYVSSYALAKEPAASHFSLKFQKRFGWTVIHFLLAVRYEWFVCFTKVSIQNIRSLRLSTSNLLFVFSQNTACRIWHKQRSRELKNSFARLRNSLVANNILANAVSIMTIYSRNSFTQWLEHQHMLHISFHIKHVLGKG